MGIISLCTKGVAVKLVNLSLLLLTLLFVSISCREKYDNLIIDIEYYWQHDTLYTAPEPKPLQFYIDSVKLFSDRQYYSINEENKILIDTIGFISNHRIIDVIFKGMLGDGFFDVGKMTLIETSSSKYKLLYNCFADPGCIGFKNSTLIKNDTLDILYTKSRFSGQMTWYSQNYWVYDKRKQCFFTFDHNPPKELINELAPDSCTLGSFNFDLNTLYWHGYLKKPSDHWHWPTCGGISVWYALEGCSLTVIKSEFNQNDTATH